MTKSILDYIHHPLTNKKIETRSATGKKIIAKYVSVIHQIGGNDTLNLNPLIDYKFEIAERNKQLKLLDEIQDKSILRNELDKIGIDHSGKHSLWILKTLARDWLLGEEYIHIQIMINKLKIGYFADGPWSHNAFLKIINDQRFEIKFITPRIDSKDKTLLNFCHRYKIEYLKLDNVNSKLSLEKISSYNCDLLVSMSFNQIFRKDIINITPIGIINCHAGKLPFYRGRNILNWALINDEKEFGITVHFVDEGIDTGDIILQKTYPITEKDSYKPLLDISYSSYTHKPE